MILNQIDSGDPALMSKVSCSAPELVLMFSFFICVQLAQQRTHPSRNPALEMLRLQERRKKRRNRREVIITFF